MVLHHPPSPPPSYGGAKKGVVMLIIRRSDIHPSEITDQALFWDRRTFLRTVGGAGAALLAGPVSVQATPRPQGMEDKLTPFEDVTSYNNYYEFGTDKADPGENAHTLKPRPWSVVVDGEVHKPGTLEIGRASCRERVYVLV